MVSKQIKSKRVARPAAGNETGRKLWLAGLGAVSLAQKQGEKIVSTLVAEGEDFKSRTERYAKVLQKDVRRAATDVQKQVKGYVTPIRRRVASTLQEFESGVGERIGAVLGRFGVPSKGDIEELLGRVAELNKQVRSTARGKRAA